jgi:dihydrofolate reductase
MIVSIIVATAKNNAIGKDNKLLWYLPKDLKHFKDVTTGHTVIMGRKTFDSVGKPLPNRRNIILTQQDIEIEGCEVTNSFDSAFELCEGEEEVFIIGGANIYRQGLPLTDRIYLTLIDEDFDGDTFFPVIDDAEWEVKEREDFEPDEKNKFRYAFITLERR